jgi:predicted O-linked N-acetylglucosamine transferase (SPINDLY family)
VDDLFSRAVAAQREGDFAAAERDYRQILALDPRHSVSLSNLGVILGRRGELAEAVAVAEAAIQADPNLAVAHFNLGNLYRRIGRSADAVQSYEQVLRLTPGFAQAVLNLGLAKSEQEDWAGALEHFQRAQQMQPNHADAAHHLGEALTRLDRAQEAIPFLRSAVQMAPQLPRSYLALARALIVVGQVEEAIHTIEHALQIQPEHAFAHHLLGMALERIGRVDEAYQHMREAVRIRPDFAAAWSNLGVILNGLGRTTEAADALGRSAELRPEPHVAGLRLAVLLGSSAMSAEQLHNEHANWAARYTTNIPPIGQTLHVRSAGGKLRIGYVFGEFQNSAAPAFLEAVLRSHDRQRFHVACYASTAQTHEMLDRVRAGVDVWSPIAGLSDQTAAERIHADGIDLLIDLNGHVKGNRLLVFARKPARVQATLFGYPSTTGLAAIDYRISDAVADPAGIAETLGSEKIIRLPDLGRVYSPPAGAPAQSPLPFSHQQLLTFGCLNSPSKLSDACISTWAQLLNRIPRSRLVLQAGRSMETVRYLGDQFVRRGIELSRLTLVYRMPEEDYLRAYQSIDLALDPFPFNGRATTCDALWMGVPVLTVAGTDCRSRQGFSILQNLGLADFVAPNLEMLIELAATWAEQGDALAELRAGLRDMMLHSPVTDADAYVRHLEAAYVQMVGERG